MYIEIEEWKVSKILNLKDRIDPKPQYQRGAVWSEKKNRLLIDSILRGMDIPKFYLRETAPESHFDYEVADGQQRLRAVWGFSDNEFVLGDCEVNGIDISKFSYSSLKESDTAKDFYSNFRNFKITVSIIKNATDDEVRTLFARLQMGTALNQPELRNAVASNVGYAIDMIVNTHQFFANAYISNARFKCQDYMAHAITLIHYKNEVNLKAYAILNMYEDLSIKYPGTYFTMANKILGWMHKINTCSNYRIRNKWAFIDFFWFLYSNYNQIKDIDYKNLADSFVKFEDKRLLHNTKPEILIESSESSIRDKYLYDYIVAFNYSGGYIDNINIRAKVFEHKFSKHINYKSV